ncbi:MAG: hypothetical protein HC798_04180 [Polaribacter sp.]|nr:hypothetical protein [Polaribacter sp.]
MYQNLNDLLIPVIIYGITISSFGALSFLHFLNTKSNASLWLFLGLCFYNFR